VSTARTPRFPRSQAAIAGIGCTDYSKNSGVSAFALAARAVKAAVADAGLELSDVDGLCTFGPDDSVAPNYLAPALGIDSMNFYLDHKLGGSVAMSVVGQAALAVSAGVAECVVVYRALNGRSARRAPTRPDEPPPSLKAVWDNQYKLPSGYVAAAQEIAMAARAHMERYGTTSEDLGRIAVLSRAHAVDNERAVMRKPLSLDGYLESRWIVEPFRLLDCCLQTDGGAAVVVVSAERARDLPHRPVHIRGAAWGGGFNLVNNGRTELADSPAVLLADKLYGVAGLGPADIDFAEFYDCFTYTVLSQLEGYGFTEPGGVPALLADGAFARDGGSLPVNTHGGLLSEAYIHSVNHLYEAVEQIRGDAGARQLARHDTALVTSQLGYLSGYSSALVVEGA
jgi:acetyl-CoA acetyltransferase